MPAVSLRDPTKILDWQKAKINKSNMKKIFAALAITFASLLATTTAAHAEVQKDIVPSPDGKLSAQYKCVNYVCDAWVVDASKNRIPVASKVKTSSVGMQWLGPELAEFSFSCGSPCSVQYYYHAAKGKSRPFQQVLAVDSTRLCLLEADEKALKVVPMYADKKTAFLTIKYTDPAYRFSSEVAVPYAGIDARFNKDGSLTLSYTDSNDKDVTKKVKADCK